MLQARTTLPCGHSSARDYIQALLSFLSDWVTCLLQPHLVDFYSHSHAQLLSTIHEDWLPALASLPPRRLLALPLTGILPTDNLPESLSSILAHGQRLSLFQEQFMTKVTTEEQERWDRNFHLLIRQGIKHKKIHEIDRLSRTVHGVAQRVGCNKVIDVGAGKGHLSRVLALHYRLQVLSVDRSAATTESATKRLEILQQFCDRKAHKHIKKKPTKPNPGQTKPLTKSQLMKQEKRNQRNARRERDRASRKQEATENSKNIPGIAEQVAIFSENLENEKDGQNGRQINVKHEIKNTNENAQQPHKNANKSENEIPKENIEQQRAIEPKAKQIRKKPVPVQTKKISSNETQPSHPDFVAPEMGNLKTAVMRIDPAETSATDIEKLVLSHFNDTGPLLLCGLHACGDLTSGLLRIYSESPSIKAVVLVGCCYNLLTLSTQTQTQAQTQTQTKISEGPSTHYHWQGYPLSRAVREDPNYFEVSKGMMMLACQSVAAWNANEQAIEQALLNFHKHHFRAMLQVLLVERFGTTKSNISIGPMAHMSKETSFREYALTALRKLKLTRSPSSPSPSQSQEQEEEEEEAKMMQELEVTIDEVYAKYNSQEQTLIGWWMLKCSFAPLMESLILADRLAYLEETNEQGHNALLPLFDHNLSPRCFALLSEKTK